MMIELALLRGNCCIGLRIDKDISDQDGERLIVVNKMDGLGPLEVLSKLIPKNAIMLRRQTDGKMYLLNGTAGTGMKQLAGDCKQRQNEIALILGLVPAVVQSLPESV